jgi:hypothetical protein
MQSYSQIALRLQIYGFRKLTVEELRQTHEKVKKAVEIGLEKRLDDSIAEGGVLAIPTKCDFINYHEWEKVRNGKYVIVCNYGGTHWVTGLRRKMNDKFEKIGKDLVVVFPVQNRSFTFNEFIGLIKTEICKIDNMLLKHADTLGLALGFAQRPEWTEHGLDARLIPKEMTKYWEISDMRNLPYSGLIGEELLNRLNHEFPDIKSIYVRNDAEVIGNDVTMHNIYHLPLTFVMGTGINMVINRKRDKQNVNLELGQAKIELDTFTAVEYMHRSSDIDKRENILEYHCGGDFVKSKVFHGLKNLALLKDANALLRLFENDEEGELVSKLAKKEIMGLNFEDAEIASIVATAALTQAGQLAGCAFSAVMEASGYMEECKSGGCALSTDGSMLHKAHLVKEVFLNTVNEFLNTDKILLLESNGMDGMGKFALVKHENKTNC